MPTYVFRNKVSGEQTEKFMSLREREQYLQDNPDLEPVFGAPALVDPGHLGRLKPSEGFRDVLRNIKKNNVGSKINTF